jgi:uncharacterized protein (DUF58 family)
MTLFQHPASVESMDPGSTPWELGRGSVIEPAFHRGWLVGLLVIFFAGYLFQYPALVLTGYFLIVFRFGAHWYAQRALAGVTYHRDFSKRRTFPGEETVMTVEIANRKWLPLSWLAAVDHWAAALSFFGANGQAMSDRSSDLVTLLFSLRGSEQARRNYRIRPEKRGVYTFGPTAVTAGDPFGLFSRRAPVERRDVLIVYPHLVPLEALHLPYQAPFGEVAAQHSMLHDPVRTVGVRDYHPEDSFRYVHWKASARRQALQVRVFEPTTAYTLVLMLNVATFARHWEGTRSELLERAVSAAASIASHAVERRWLVGLAANGAMANADQPIRVPPGRGPDQLSFLLEALAGVTSFTTSPFEQFLLSESNRVAWGATLVVVTTVVTEEIRASLDRLRAAGRQIVLVALTAQPPETSEDLIVYHVPNEGLAFDPEQPGAKARLNLVSGRTLEADPSLARQRHMPARALGGVQ